MFKEAARHQNPRIASSAPTPIAKRVKVMTPTEVQRGTWAQLIAEAWLIEQGFYVFRNVADRGPVDLVAMKDADILLIDVKTTTIKRQLDGSFCNLSKPRDFLLTPLQLELGVTLLYVSQDGICDFDVRRLADKMNAYRAR